MSGHKIKGMRANLLYLDINFRCGRNLRFTIGFSVSFIGKLPVYIEWYISKISLKKLIFDYFQYDNINPNAALRRLPENRFLSIYKTKFVCYKTG